MARYRPDAGVDPGSRGVAFIELPGMLLAARLILPFPL
jgi:hypothetical protein